MRRERDSFWPSYVDIMTTLFAIMLVLFAVTYVRFKTKETQLNALVNEYNDIINVYSQIDAIDKSNYYAYDSLYLKHTLSVSITYQDKKYNIENNLAEDLTNKALADKKREDIKQAGILIENTIQNLEKVGKESRNIKFLVIIEGQSSKIPFFDNDWQNNKTLSFLRAEYLKKYWTEECGLFKFSSENDINSKCEIIVAGSGEGGVPRNFYTGRADAPISRNPSEEKYNSVKDVPASEYATWRNVEVMNQRFLINIIPIIGNIDVTKAKIANVNR